MLSFLQSLVQVERTSINTSFKSRKKGMALEVDFEFKPELLPSGLFLVRYFTSLSINGPDCTYIPRLL